MNSISLPRLTLFLGGLAAIVAAYALQMPFPLDVLPEPPPPPVPVSEPSVAAMFAIGGVVAIVASLLGRRRK